MTKNGRGGARPGSGPPIRDLPSISPAAARTLRTLLRLSGGEYNKERIKAWIEAQIEREWSEYDDEIQRAAEKAAQWEGEVL